MQSDTRANTLLRLLAPLIIGFIALRLLATAWVADDAYITFRVVDNILGGYGAVWNIDERVQVYTHPLWMLLLVPVNWIIPNIYLASIGLCFTCFGAALWLVFRQFPGHVGRTALLFLLPVSFSLPVIEYAASGLENPLGMLLIAWLALEIMQPPSDGLRFRRLAFISALLLLTRLDYALLILPLWVWLFTQIKSLRRLPQIVFGAWPLAAWFGFSLFYYGFLFPNTKYAKLGSGVPAAELAAQGQHYLSELMVRDMLSFVCLLATPLAVCLLRLAGRLPGTAGICALGLSAGCVLYGAYVIAVGGDFMGGRFWAVPLFVCCMLLPRLLPQALIATNLRILLFSSLLAVSAFFSARHHELAWEQGCAAIGKPVQNTGTDETVCSFHGIMDERRFYSYARSATALLDRESFRIRLQPEGIPVQEGLDLRHTRPDMPQTVKMAGMPGYFAGPDVILVDELALTDPLLARLPANPGKWRIGHFTRDLPAGYIKARRGDDYSGMDKDLAEYYKKLRVVVSGDLLSAERLQAIMGFQLKTYDQHLNAYIKRISAEGGSE